MQIEPVKISELTNMDVVISYGESGSGKSSLVNVINQFRNRVYHHNCLLDDNYIINELKSKTLMLFRYLPSPKTLGRHVDNIYEESKRVGNKYGYSINFSQAELDEIMEYRGCNNGCKN